MSRGRRVPDADGPVPAPQGRGSRQRILIDSDPGLDDLLALSLAVASPGLELAALTTVAGNASIETVTENALRFRALAGADLPIGRGAPGPLSLEAVDATGFHGPDGRRAVPMPEPDDRTTTPAAGLLQACIEDPGLDRIVAIGPLTNLATLLRESPSSLDGVELIWMGGTLSRGNVTELAEFNCYADPEAVAVVLSSGVALKLIGLEATSSVLVRERDLGAAPFGPGTRARFLEGLVRALIDAERASLGESAAMLHDPTAVIAATDPELFRFEDLELEVRVEEGSARGQLVRVESARMRRVQYAVEVQGNRASELFLSRLRSWAYGEGAPS